MNKTVGFAGSKGLSGKSLPFLPFLVLLAILLPLPLLVLTVLFLICFVLQPRAAPGECLALSARFSATRSPRSPPR